MNKGMMKRVLNEYKRLDERQIGYELLMLISIGLSVTMWMFCGDYQEGKLFVLVAGAACCAALAVAAVCLSVKKRILIRAALRRFYENGSMVK